MTARGLAVVGIPGIKLKSPESSSCGAILRHLEPPGSVGRYHMAKQGPDDREKGLGRREVLECMVWAGTGVLWTITGGVPHSVGLIWG